MSFRKNIGFCFVLFCLEGFFLFFNKKNSTTITLERERDREELCRYQQFTKNYYNVTCNLKVKIEIDNLYIN